MNFHVSILSLFLTLTIGSSGCRLKQSSNLKAIATNPEQDNLVLLNDEVKEAWNKALAFVKSRKRRIDLPFDVFWLDSDSTSLLRYHCPPIERWSRKTLNFTELESKCGTPDFIAWEVVEPHLIKLLKYEFENSNRLDNRRTQEMLREIDSVEVLAYDLIADLWPDPDADFEVIVNAAKNHFLSKEEIQQKLNNMGFKGTQAEVTAFAAIQSILEIYESVRAQREQVNSLSRQLEVDRINALKKSLKKLEVFFPKDGSEQVYLLLQVFNLARVELQENLEDINFMDLLAKKAIDIKIHSSVGDILRHGIKDSKKNISPPKIKEVLIRLAKTFGENSVEGYIEHIVALDGQRNQLFDYHNPLTKERTISRCFFRQLNDSEPLVKLLRGTKTFRSTSRTKDGLYELVPLRKSSPEKTNGILLFGCDGQKSDLAVPINFNYPVLAFEMIFDAGGSYSQAPEQWVTRKGLPIKETHPLHIEFSDNGK